MKKIGLFYGTDTGNTETIAEQIADLIRGRGIEIDSYDIFRVKERTLEDYEYLVLGVSTWYDGELQSDWDDYFYDFEKIDFTGKKVAIFGLGDQYGYSETFLDGVGILGEAVLEKNGKLYGKWSTESYYHDESVAELEEGLFCGLAIDEDNQSELTDERVDKWVNQILEEFEI